ncbi:GNAT family N-acetyltransferase [Legionella jamestowniensis]|uniref:GCN5 family acetyltransferase n=1 Tax=Legionella jamestowniensis TaxID=455 RepID=A0A0W0UKV1_9GAMM|nr:GNAT family N-acetyltransferase [Legionella jamestowniensis]KTD08520.1 GNAT family acetyltransferase [Legionella jamestowniensis]OCH97017.1 GCN5 family acetyltransferase [Legionella jamestowniensis]SFL52365.1 putative acetyltransferase [Legionella jamestowniensis DSM 19215]
MEHQICNVTKKNYLELIEIWEKAVRATHNFLPENEIKELKPLILNHYFDVVTLHGSKNKEGKIIGFIGVADNKIEMLFISPDVQGQGIGSALCRYAITDFGVTKVDVNEQNPQAKKFYEKMGFEIVSRSALDGQGKPYPILHMQLRKKL